MSKGLYARVGADWQINQMAAACGFIAGAGGFNSAVSLYNNSARGYFLWVYGMWANLQGNTDLDLRQYQGTWGALVNSGGPLVFNQANVEGQIYTRNNSANFPGVECGHFGLPSTSQFWPYPWPVAVIPPSWSLVLIASQQNIAFTAAFWWAALPYPAN